MKIKIELNSKINLLLMNYQYFKEQSSFNNFADMLANSNFNANHRQLLKDFFRGNGKIKLNTELEEIYEKNKENWEKYWKENLPLLEKAKAFFEKRIKSFDFLKFNSAERFFKSEPLKEIILYLSMGNESELGTGNSFKPGTCAVFIRNFPNMTEKTLEQDFAVLIHEIVHLYQNCKNIDKNALEKMTRAFAPRGVIINREKIKSGSEDEKLVIMIEDAIKSGKTINDLTKYFQN